MISQLNLYLDWLAARGVKFPAPLVEPEAAAKDQKLTLYSHSILTESELLMFQRIAKLAKEHGFNADIVQRGDLGAEEKLLHAAQNNEKIILFQLGISDLVQGPLNPSDNVLVTANASTVAANPSVKRLLWEQIQVLLKIDGNYV